jgi:hypothetical protein
MSDSKWYIALLPEKAGKPPVNKGILVTKLSLKLVGFDIPTKTTRDYSTNGIFLK